MRKNYRKKRSKIRGDSTRPRLSVFRSKRYIYAQIIDDSQGKTLAAASDKEAEKSKKGKASKSGNLIKANLTGRLLAQKAIRLKLKKVVFDRGRYPYHGRVKALADGAREGGLVF